MVSEACPTNPREEAPGLDPGAVHNVKSRRYVSTIERDREKIRQQRTRLSVLNRVLRHNLRNGASVILTLTDNLVAETDGELTTQAQQVQKSTRSLVDIGEKARRIDRVLDSSTVHESVQLGHFLEECLEGYAADNPGVEFSLDGPGEDIRLRTNRTVLTAVLDELVENAIEHGGGTRVALTSTTTDEGHVTLSVADDGPGIPEAEYEALFSDSETALTHGSGLGLWLVKWGAQTLDGRLSVGASEWGGAEVALTFPRTLENDYDDPSS